MTNPEEDVLPTFDFPMATPAGPAKEAVPVAKPAAPPAVAVQVKCPCCQAVRGRHDHFCGDCGWFYKDPYPSEEELAGGAVPEAAPMPTAAPVRVKGRYELMEQLGERLGVERFAARDLGLDGSGTTPVIVLRQAAPQQEEAIAAVPLEAEPVAALPVSDDEILPSFDDVVIPTAGPVTEVIPSKPVWPSVAWERDLLDSVDHPGLPAVIDTFFEEGFQYIVEEVPHGTSLWDFWDDQDLTYRDRFAGLVKVAELLQALHNAGAMVEGIRPDIFVFDPQGNARITDLGDLLALPVPPNAQLRGRLYTAPELLTSPGSATARADLYSFGAMMLALYVHRELTEKEFNKGQLNWGKLFMDYPDLHPAFARLLMKTLSRSVDARFPTDEAMKTDPTGFDELIKTLKVCGRVMDQCRLEIAAWTTTGIVRTGNEDAFAFLHACESRQDDVSDTALLLLADGMGGYDAGEVAAAMAIAQLRKNLTALKPFNATAGASGFPTEIPQAENAPPPLDVEQAKTMIKAALKDANRHVFTASRTPGVGKRGMGCTAEVVYVDGRNLVVGHVGDSRVYHLSEGNLVQVTRDQTLVNRLVELGTLSADEAENHPRKNELQQAIGGQPDVEPGIYTAKLMPGDFVVVCSDGLTNHVKDKVLREFLRGDDGGSAERAARRLVHLVNMEGATDNATIIVVRAT